MIYVVCANTKIATCKVTSPVASQVASEGDFACNHLPKLEIFEDEFQEFFPHTSNADVLRCWFTTLMKQFRYAWSLSGAETAYRKLRSCNVSFS